jgi:hypothetical protein
MANKVTLKRSSVQGKAPQTSDLDYGEVALNFTDGRLYFRNSNDQIEFFDSNVGGEESASLVSLLDGDLGSVANSDLQNPIDFGSVNQDTGDSVNLGDISLSGFITPDILSLPKHQNNSLPSPSLSGQLIYVTDSDDYIESGYVDDGYASGTGTNTIAFSDGESWNELSIVSLTGDYNDLTNTPDLSSFATETYVNTAINDLVDSAPEALDTLNELAAALDSDPDFAATVTNQLSLKVDSSSLSTVATTGDYEDLTNKPSQGGISTGKAIAMAIVFG